jgi:uncharacterized cupredoxin-like copper-binding protein
MRGRGRVFCALAVGWLSVSVAAAAYAFATSDTARANGPLGPGHAEVTLDINHSRFTPARVVVHEGTTVTFTIVNNDPIAHEFIVGNAEVHRIHQSGTHGQHGDVLGEVSVAPGRSATTSFTFDMSGTVLFACHLPGHFTYGMLGEVIVKES